MLKSYEKFAIKSNKSLNRQSQKETKLLKFSEILRRMKGDKKPKIKIKLDDQTQEELEKLENKNPLTEKVKLENQKTLAKLYQNNYTQTFEDLKKDFEKAKNKALLTETSNKLTKETLEKTSFSFPKNKKPKYGFMQFDRTNYVAKSCMKEFYEKYSKYDTLRRK